MGNKGTQGGGSNFASLPKKKGIIWKGKPRREKTKLVSQPKGKKRVERKRRKGGEGKRLKVSAMTKKVPVTLKKDNQVKRAAHAANPVRGDQGPSNRLEIERSAVAHNSAGKVISGNPEVGGGLTWESAPGVLKGPRRRKKGAEKTSNKPQGGHEKMKGKDPASLLSVGKNPNEGGGEITEECNRTKTSPKGLDMSEPRFQGTARGKR